MSTNLSSAARKPHTRIFPARALAKKLRHGGKMKYKIAIFTSDWNYNLVTQFYNGLYRFLDEHPEVSVYVFDCFAGKAEEGDAGYSEFQIFSLPDLHDFDGAVIQGNQILSDKLRNQIIARAAEAGIPIVSSNYPSAGCTYIGTENYEAMSEIVEHLISHHVVRNMAYIGGYIESREAQDRKRAFVDVCQKHGVTDYDTYDTYWLQKNGNEVTEKILGGTLPEAIVCANDDMAFGVCETLHDHGLDVPGDVLVTGFDDVWTSECFQPRLTTVNRDYSDSAYRSMSVLYEQMITGDRSVRVEYSKHTPVFSESCGCHDHIPNDMVSLKRTLYTRERMMREYHSIESRMIADMMDAISFDDIFTVFEDNAIKLFNCKNVYLCINKTTDMAEGDDLSDYTDHMMLVAYSGEKSGEYRAQHVYHEFDKKEILPEDFRIPSQLIVLYPLHYQAACIGYIAMDGVSPAGDLNLLESTFSLLDMVIENMRKKYQLRRLNKRLDELYIRDNLTGLYNRFGYDKIGVVRFHRILEEGGEAEILFIDIDCMKAINDQHGHKAGDTALITVADAIRNAVGIERDNVFSMRYGGDEFLIIRHNDGRDVKHLIRAFLDKKNKTDEYSFELTVSIGRVITSYKQNHELGRLITEADQLMYEIKKKKKIK